MRFPAGPVGRDVAQVVDDEQRAWPATRRRPQPTTDASRDPLDAARTSSPTVATRPKNTNTNSLAEARVAVGLRARPCRTSRRRTRHPTSSSHGLTASRQRQSRDCGHHERRRAPPSPRPRRARPEATSRTGPTPLVRRCPARRRCSRSRSSCRPGARARRRSAPTGAPPDRRRPSPDRRTPSRRAPARPRPAACAAGPRGPTGVTWLDVTGAAGTGRTSGGRFSTYASRPSCASSLM